MAKSNAARQTDEDDRLEDDRKIWLVFEGRTGRNSEFEQLGDHTTWTADGEPITLTPGLQAPITSATWDTWKRVSDIAEMLDAKTLRIVDEQLTEYRAGGSMRALVMATAAPEALEHMMGIEMAKPAVGRSGERRDPDLIETIERRSQLMMRRKRADMTGVLAQAQQDGKALAAGARRP